MCRDFNIQTKMFLAAV